MHRFSVDWSKGFLVDFNGRLLVELNGFLMAIKLYFLIGLRGNQLLPLICGWFLNVNCNWVNREQRAGNFKQNLLQKSFLQIGKKEFFLNHKNSKCFSIWTVHTQKEQLLEEFWAQFLLKTGCVKSFSTQKRCKILINILFKKLRKIWAIWPINFLENFLENDNFKRKVP